MNWRSGYSLFEVLVAFAVMSLVLAVLLPGQVGLLQRTQLAAEQALAQDYATSRLELARVTGDVPAGSETYRDWRLEWSQRRDAVTQTLTLRVATQAGQALAEQTLTLREPDAE